MSLLVATTNEHKIRELRRLFDYWQIELTTVTELGLQALDVVEDGLTFEANATLKASAYARMFRRPALADDSGICVDSLAGAPGVRSARFGRPSFNDAQRTEYVLQCLRDIPAHRRGAHYTCCLALAAQDQSVLAVHGYCYGYVAESIAEGPTGFGYDPVFIPCGFTRTVAQLGEEEKDRLGHRGKAVRALMRRIAADGRESGTLNM